AATSAAHEEREPCAGLLTPDEVDQMLAAESAARLQGFDHQANRRPTSPPTPNPAQPAAADEQRFRAMLAANKFATTQPVGAHLPPTDRKPASFRATALGSTAHQPLTGTKPTPNRF
ncbi:MAG TPA: hypothetical protein VHU42_14810, partial [Rhodopila sp.]|nr:hypothetical protein [Rhodopila sp.]